MSDFHGDRGLIDFEAAESVARAAFDGVLHSLASSPDLTALRPSWAADRSAAGLQVRWFETPYLFVPADRILSVRNWSRSGQEHLAEDPVRVHLRDYLLSGVDPRASVDRLFGDPAFDAAMSYRDSGRPPPRGDLSIVAREGLRLLDSGATRCELLDRSRATPITIVYPTTYESWPAVGVALIPDPEVSDN